jgi:hypothetical protein
LPALAKQSPLYCHREGQSPVAISRISLDELGYFDENKKNKKHEVRDEGSSEESSKKQQGKRSKKNNSFIHA